MLLVVVIVAASTLAAAALLYGARVPPRVSSGTILIIASGTGYNDSVNHAVPQNSWPIITVQRGTTVTIEVYNADRQSHGFQISHYEDASINTIAPGQTFTVTFVVDTTGTFRIYCSIFCTVHWAMQSGELIVR